jgi:hypothetical protein
MATYNQLKLTRDQLAAFLQDHEQVRQFEKLFAAINAVPTDVVATFSAGITGLTPATPTSADVVLAGTLNVANGGTGATTAATARSNLGAAASGANTDITSLSGITGSISTVDSIQFDIASAVLVDTEGELAWNEDDGTLDVGLYGGSVLQVGQETLYYAKNTSGATIAIGTPVMFTGTVGASGKLTFGLAVADGSVPSNYMMGVTAQPVANNDFGYVTSFGLVRGFDTSGTPYGETWADGDLLYFDPATAGTWTNVTPSAPNISVPVAVVINASGGGSGAIFVRMEISEALNNLQDVHINGGGPTDGQLLQYVTANSRWENTSAITADLTNNTGRLIDSSVALTNGAAAATGTLTNAPTAGNPTKWIPIDDNGTTRYIPAW